MKYTYDFEHYCNTECEYDEDSFESAKPFLKKVFDILHKNNIMPRIGEQIFCDTYPYGYYIKQIVYYKEGCTFFLDENESRVI